MHQLVDRKQFQLLIIRNALVGFYLEIGQNISVQSMRYRFFYISINEKIKVIN